MDARFMTWPAYLFFATSILGWLFWAISRRRHARAIGALLCQHRHELTLASVRGKQAGLKAANERAAHGPTTQEAVTRLTT